MLKGIVNGVEKDIVKVPMKGKNLFDYTEYAGSYMANAGLWEYVGTTGVVFRIPCNQNTRYTLSLNKSFSLSVYRIATVNTDTVPTLNNPVTVTDIIRRTSAIDSYSFTTPPDAKYILFQVNATQSAEVADATMLNLGSTPLPYEPYGYQNGWEIRDDQDRLIWGREDTFEGTDSIPINGYGTPLTSVTIKGNGQQNGTPSPQNIVPFDGTGDKTSNLVTDSVFENSTTDTRNLLQIVVMWFSGTTQIGKTANIYINATGYNVITFSISDNTCNRIYIKHNGAIRDIPITNVYGNFFGDYALSFDCISNDPTNVGGISLENIMLNLGQTALPYEPYGYKIPLTAASVTTPLYLGEVSTVRRIKKLVLTGEEAIYDDPSYDRFIIAIPDSLIIGVRLTPAVSSHYSVISDGRSIGDVPNNSIYSDSNNPNHRWFIKTTDYIDVTAFKAFLAQEYAAGHPVTIWYVLAEPETGIVNEPLMKIGDYADTLTTDTPIPTTTGATDVTVDTKIPPSELTIKVHAKKIRYGFKIDKSQENSESAVIYTHDAVTMTPAVMDFTNDRFSYGSWENAWFVRDARPCALKLDGTVAYYLDPNDATKKLDGTASDIYYELLSTEPSDWSTQWKQYYQIVSGEYVLNDQNAAPTFATNTYYKLTYNSSFTGNFMVEFPQVWFKRYEDSSYNYIEISNCKLSDDWKCYSHINKDGTLVDRIYLPMFKGIIKDSKLRSLPGQILQGGTRCTTEVNAATALGSRWQIWDHSSAELINDLLTLMSKSIDSQGRFGQGRSSGYDSTDTVTYGKLQSGTLIKKGKFHGYSATTKEVKIFGIEGFWANRLDRLQGMLLVNNVWKIKMTPPYNFTGTDFVTLSDAEVPTGNGCLSKVQSSEYGSIPASITNSSSTKYFKDYFYKAATNTRVAIRGGCCNNGGNAGFRFVGVNYTASSSDWLIGASPVYK